MEIESITVQADYCFGDQPLQLSNLKKVNFIFAPNGAGKSTISSTLAQQPSDVAQRINWDVARTSLPIRVFNEAYRSSVLTERVNGIFTIGDSSKSINDDIDALTAQIRERSSERDTWSKAIGPGQDADAPKGLVGEIEDYRIEACKTVFEAHKGIDTSIKAIVFEGYRNNREKFFNEARKRFVEIQASTPKVDWESIRTRAQSLSSDQKSRVKLPCITTVSLISKDDIAEVTRKSSHGEGGESGKFAELIRHLKNEDWVSKGRDYVDDAQGLCPFCQNRAPANLEQDLAQYFAGGFDAALQASIAIESTVKSAAEKLETEISTLEVALKGDPEIDEEDFSSAITHVRKAAELLLSKMRERSTHPTQPVTVSDVDGVISELMKLVNAENQKIDEHNQIIENAGVERGKLVKDGWMAFLSSTTVSNEIRKFNGIERTKQKAITDLQSKIEQSKRNDEDANTKIVALQNSISNTSDVANRINKLLKAMGFHRFSLSSANDSRGGYQIVREDGTHAFDSLSEGEKTFICFAYFWESLFGSEVASTVPEEVIAVIDDPISSLDSDALFMIAAYIRDAAKLAIEGTTNLRQLIVLTHNTQFHHEAAYSADRNSKQRRYFRLMKDLNGYTTVRDDEYKSKIRGSYPLLWHSVVEAAQTEDESNLVRVGVFNIVRRILEGYFKTIGNVTDFDRPSNATPLEARVVSQFHVWANSGSHTISDDIDQTIDVGRTKDFLKMFKQYFDIQGHGAHFDMMVIASDGEKLLEPDQLFARL